jgi:SAM-dependent methyltransferase
VSDAYDLIEDEFNAVLDESLDPAGPDVLFDYVAELGLPPGSVAVDVGCGEGEYAVELASRFGLTVTGLDPVERCVTAARQGAPRGVSFEVGVAGDLPFPDGSVDLVWCRDVLSLVPDLDAVYREFRRVLAPGGHALVYQMFGTDLLSPNDAGWLFPVMECVAESMRPETTEAAIGRAGLRVDRRVVFGTEWGEYAAEHGGKPGSRLLHAARLLRDPDRYIALFGQANYDIKLGDCLWHVYRMIGKLSGRAYLLSAG